MHVSEGATTAAAPIEGGAHLLWPPLAVFIALFFSQRDKLARTRLRSNFKFLGLPWFYAKSRVVKKALGQLAAGLGRGGPPKIFGFALVLR